MVETQTSYGIIKATSVLPVRDLLLVPHKNRELVVSHPAFGPDTYSNNLAEMQKTYIHLEEHPQISFKEPTTSKSTSACAYDFEKLAKPQILDSRWLQLGRIIRTSEGVFTNPPRDAQGNSILDEETLMSLKDRAKKVNGIYLGENDFGFAPYGSFTRGIQDCDTFAKGGLARLLEHTEEEVAENLRKIASKKFYKRGVNVLGFDSVEKPLLRVVCLYSGRYFDDSGLGVGGDWFGYSYGGYAFGVL